VLCEIGLSYLEREEERGVRCEASDLRGIAKARRGGGRSSECYSRERKREEFGVKRAICTA